MILGRLRDTSINGWFRCLGCFRFFTKKVDELFCPDCCAESRDR